MRRGSRGCLHREPWCPCPAEVLRSKPKSWEAWKTYEKKKKKDKKGWKPSGRCLFSSIRSRAPQKFPKPRACRSDPNHASWTERYGQSLDRWGDLCHTRVSLVRERVDPSHAMVKQTKLQLSLDTIPNKEDERQFQGILEYRYQTCLVWLRRMPRAFRMSPTCQNNVTLPMLIEGHL